jgi:N-acetylmuramoyl-L-alanine amidase
MSAFLSLIAVILFAGQSDQGAAGFPLSMNGRTVLLATQESRGHRMFVLDEFVGAVGGELVYSQGGLRARWEFSGEAIEFSHGSPYYRAGRRFYSLPAACGFEGGVFVVPLRFLTRDLEELLPDAFRFDKNAEVLRDISDYAHLKSFRTEVGRESTSISLLTTRAVEFALDNTRSGTFLVNLYRTRISSAVEDSIASTGYVDSLRVIPYAEGAQLVFHLDGRAKNYKVEETRRPVGLLISFKGEPLGEETAASASSPPEKHSSKAPARDYRIRKVMIDPGHGGKDPGAMAGRNVVEKDINLKVSRMLAPLLEKEGFEVIMTRKDDTFIPLSRRTAMANENGTDLFVSIHCNASKNKNACGFEVYFLSEAKTDEERTVAHRENMSLTYERPGLDPSTLGDLQFIFWDLAQNEFLQESYECARIIVEEVSRGQKKGRAGVRQAGFYVLNGVYMPSVLIEIAYLSHPEERKMLTDDAYLRKLTARILEGLITYINTYNARVNG